MTFMKPARTVATTSSTDFAPLITAIDARYTASPRPVSTSRRTRRLNNDSDSSRTGDLDGRHDEVAREDLEHARAHARAPREGALEEPDERVPERRRHERAVRRHLDGACVDACAGEDVRVEWGVRGHAPRGEAGEVRREDLLCELQDRCAWTWGG